MQLLLIFFKYRCKIINLYYYNNLKKESKSPAFIRKFGKSIRIFKTKNVQRTLIPLPTPFGPLSVMDTLECLIVPLGVAEG